MSKRRIYAQRAIGAFLLLVGVAGIALTGVGATFGYRAIDQLVTSLDPTLSLASDSLETVEATLVQTQAALASVNELLDTASEAAVNLGQTIEATGQSVDQISQMASTDMPAILEALGTVAGDLAQATGAIDAALETLSLFTRGLVDLGAAVPDTQPARDLETSLTSLGGDVHALAADLGQISQALEPVSRDATQVAGDLAAINEDLRGFGPLFDEYIEMVQGISATADATRANLSDLGRMGKTAITLLAIWLGALHVTPLYLGCELVSGRRKAEVVEAAQDTNGQITEPANQEGTQTAEPDDPGTDPDPTDQVTQSPNRRCPKPRTSRPSS